MNLNPSDMSKRLIGVGSFTTTPHMKELVLRALNTDRISYGPMSRKLERIFSSLHDCEFGVLSNSGTSSLQVALQAMKEIHGWKDGDEVLCPAATFVATINVVLHNRMTPVLVDIEDGMWSMNPGLISDAITDRTRAVIPVHPFGQPADILAISAISRLYELKIIEDSCECVFSSQFDRSVGSWGDIGCFSFYVAHIITAGVGGIAITNNPDYAVKMRSLVNHGRDNVYISIDDDDNLSTSRLKEVIGKRFNFTSVGHSFRITELEAAIALAQVDNKSYWNNISRRNYNAGFLHGYLSDLHGDRLQLMDRRPNTVSSYMMFPIVCRYDEKQHLCEYLESHGIETRDALPLAHQPVYDGMFDWSKYPVAEKLNKYGFYVGCHNDLTPDDLYYMGRVFTNYFDEHPKTS